MKSIFRIDSPLFLFLGRVADLMLLNLVFLGCCVPVVTVGPALTALFYVTMKIAEKKDVSVARDFFRSFRQNFKDALIIWLVLALVGALLAFDLYSMRDAADSLNIIMRTAVIILCVLYVMTGLYVFPLLARYENTIVGTLRMAAILAIVNIPRTLLMLLLPAVAVALTLLTETTLKYGLFAWLVIGFSFIAWISSFLLSRAFSSLKAPENVEEQQAPSDDAKTQDTSATEK